jgi:hypothetical protein
MALLRLSAVEVYPSCSNPFCRARAPNAARIFFAGRRPIELMKWRITNLSAGVLPKTAAGFFVG